MDSIKNPNVDGFGVTANQEPTVHAKQAEIPATNALPVPEVKPATQPQPTVSSNQQPQPNNQNATAQTSVQSQNVHTDSSTARDLHTQSLQNLSAEDSDLIEKTWVDRTEQVISANKDDPYVEDEHQHQLSRTYLKKRFNLDVK